jgi:hypothetical protein
MMTGHVRGLNTVCECVNLHLTIFCLITAMLSGSTVTTAWRVLGLRIEETASRYGG